MLSFGIGSVLSVCSLHAQSSNTEHIVKPGETLYGIATMYNINVGTLKNANAGISDNISVGQKLIIPAVSSSQRFHTIAAKETLYSISRKYNIEISEIIKANPGLNEQNFKAGATIVIPAGGLSATNVNITESKPEGIAGSNCREMYKVKRKDTFFTIAKKFDLTVEELAAANPDIPAPDFKISKGDYLCIPFANDKSFVSNAQAFEQKNISSPKNNINISLIMPFYENGDKARESVQFYRGMLAAVDSLRKSGTSFNITAKDASNTVADANSQLQDTSIRNSDLIVAAAGEAGLGAIADYCKNNSIKLLLPFNNEFSDVYNNPQVILSGQPESYSRAATVQHFISKYSFTNIIYINCLAGDEKKSYAEMLLPSMNVNGTAYKTINLNATDEELANAFDQSRNNIIVLSSNSKEAYQNVTKRLDNISARLAAMDYSIFGHKEWIDFDLQLRNTFFKHNVTILTPRYINVFSSYYPQFLEMYKSHFKQAPTSIDQRAFFSGFDFGMYLLKGISSYGPAFETQTVKVSPMEKPISFSRVNNWGGLINKAYRVVRFTKFQTTEITDYAQ